MSANDHFTEQVDWGHGELNNAEPSQQFRILPPGQLDQSILPANLNTFFDANPAFVS